MRPRHGAARRGAARRGAARGVIAHVRGSGKTVARVVIRSSQDRNWSRRWKIGPPLPSLFVSRGTFRPAIISFYEISRAYPALPAVLSLRRAYENVEFQFLRFSNFDPIRRA